MRRENDDCFALFAMILRLDASSSHYCYRLLLVASCKVVVCNVRAFNLLRDTLVCTDDRNWHRSLIGHGVTHILNRAEISSARTAATS